MIFVSLLRKKLFFHFYIMFWYRHFQVRCENRCREKWVIFPESQYVNLNPDVFLAHHLKAQALFSVLANKYVKAANENPYHASSGVQINIYSVYNEVNESFKKKIRN